MKLKALTIALLLTIPTYSPAGSDLPTEAQRLWNQYEKTRTDGLIKLNTDYVEKLKRVQKSLMKQGDLEGANAIETKVKALEEETRQIKVGRKEPPKTKVSKAELMKPFLGEWFYGKDNEYMREFKRDGVCIFYHKGKKAGQWDWEVIDATTAITIYSEATKDEERKTVKCTLISADVMKIADMTVRRRK